MRNFSKKGGSKILTVIYIFFICILAGIVIVSCKDYSETPEGSSESTEDDDANHTAVDNDNFGNDLDENGSGDSDDGDLLNDEVDENIINDDSDTLIDEVVEEETNDEESADEEGQTDGEEIQDEEENSEQNGNEEIDFSSSDNFRIDVDLLAQKVFVYYKDKIIKTMICSGGTVEKPTPPGEFTTTEKGYWFWNSTYNMGAFYWIRFKGEYLFHSVPIDKNYEILQEEYEKLGTPASHGCIRLAPEDAEWLYEMLPLGVKVVIH
ncbi:MAG: hypothetical protein A2Z35_05035 [Actinobacteria bacterium RBG_19FT_COMBO_36_27]|nr:MAG: hypothetical protein A2Z35_05035 [Actinobacteria bacterium RBG_19FT_COMBO_36_27]